MALVPTAAGSPAASAGAADADDRATPPRAVPWVGLPPRSGGSGGAVGIGGGHDMGRGHAPSAAGR
eukprot:gene52438-62307_t